MEECNVLSSWSVGSSITSPVVGGRSQVGSGWGVVAGPVFIFVLVAAVIITAAAAVAPVAPIAPIVIVAPAVVVAAAIVAVAPIAFIFVVAVATNLLEFFEV